MFDEFNLISLLMFLLTGGGNDLVSYIPPDEYWAAKGVEVVSVETMLGELDRPATDGGPPEVAKWVESLGAADAGERERAAKALLAAGPAALGVLERETASPDVEVARRTRQLAAQIRTEAKPREVRRLMAMRALGQLKDPRALAGLRAWADAAGPFEREYARAAIARIEGHDVSRPATQAAGDALAADLELLPASCAVVGQVQTRPGLAPPFQEAIATLELPEAARESRLRQIAAQLIAAAERYGNLRVDGATLGLSVDFTGRTGFAIVVLRGAYDADLATLAARLERLPSTTVGAERQTAFDWGPDARLLFPSNDRLVLVAAADPAGAPVGELAAAVATGRGTLRDNAELAKLIDEGRGDPGAARPTVWAVGRLTPALRSLPLLDGIDVVRLTGEQQGTSLRLRLSATPADPARAKASADAAAAAVKGLLPDLTNYAEFMPPLRPVRDLLRGATLTPTPDGTVTGEATWDGSLSRLFAFALYPYTLAADAGK